jgi:hypothetical protein
MASRAVRNVVFALALAGSCLHAAQGINKPLTNRDVETMREAESLWRARRVPSDVVPGLPERRGLYHQGSGGQWIPLAASLVWPDMRSRWRWTSEFQDRLYVLAGRQAYLEVNEARPSFHLRDPTPDGEWVLFRLTRRGSTRQLRIRLADAFAYGPGHQFHASAHGGVEVSALAADVLLLRPEADLEPGEYLLVKLSRGQRWIPSGYAFRVAFESRR